MLMLSIAESPRIISFGLCRSELWHREQGGQLRYGELPYSRLSLCRSAAVSIVAEDSSALDSSHSHDGYDEMQALILSPPYGTKGKSNTSSQVPTLLELEALAMEGVSLDFSRRERSEAVNELLDLLEQKGVPSGYAFEFVRHATMLIDELIGMAKEGYVTHAPIARRVLNSQLQQQSLLADRMTETIEPSLDDDLVNCRKNKMESIQPLPEKMSSLGRRASRDGSANLFRNTSFASKIGFFAEQRGIPRLVYYFHMLNMKALDIPKVLPFVGQRIDAVMAKVEFLRSIGVRASHLPVVLASCPQLLSYECDHLALVEEFLKGLGFTHKEMGAFVQKHPHVLGRDVGKDLRQSLEFLEDLGVPLKDMKKLLLRHPVLITEDAEKSLKPLVVYLESIGVKQKHIGPLLIRRPVLVTSNVEKDLWPVGDYLKTIHASADDIDKIITSFPRVFCYNLDQDFRPAVSHLETLGVDSMVMGKLFRRHPQLLKNRLSFELKTNFLINLGLEKKDLGKVIYNAPQLLGLSVEDKMQPTTQFLESIGVKGSALLKVIKRKPMILAHSIDTKLQPNAQFLERLGIKHESIGKLVTRHPQLLTLSVEKNLDPTIMYLMGLDFTRDEVADMVRRLPSLLGFSVVTVLEPKYNYLVDTMKRSPKELVRFPHFFSYSLVNRIIPRHQILGEACESHSLSSIYGCNDMIFEKKLYKWKLVCVDKTEPP